MLRNSFQHSCVQWSWVKRKRFFHPLQIIAIPKNSNFSSSFNICPVHRRQRGIITWSLRSEIRNFLSSFRGYWNRYEMNFNLVSFFSKMNYFLGLGLRLGFNISTLNVKLRFFFWSWLNFYSIEENLSSTPAPTTGKCQCVRHFHELFAMDEGWIEQSVGSLNWFWKYLSIQ